MPHLLVEFETTGNRNNILSHLGDLFKRHSLTLIRDLTSFKRTQEYDAKDNIIKVMSLALAIGDPEQVTAAVTELPSKIQQLRKEVPEVRIRFSNQPIDLPGAVTNPAADSNEDLDDGFDADEETFPESEIDAYLKEVEIPAKDGVQEGEIPELASESGNEAMDARDLPMIFEMLKYYFDNNMPVFALPVAAGLYDFFIPPEGVTAKSQYEMIVEPNSVNDTSGMQVQWYLSPDENTPVLSLKVQLGGEVAGQIYSQIANLIQESRDRIISQKKSEKF